VNASLDSDPATIRNSIHGVESRSQWEHRLETTRLIQERAWFEAGYSRDDIIRMFGNWPAQLGYPAYHWTVGSAQPGDASPGSCKYY
jgi:hypothetical protein